MLLALLLAFGLAQADVSGVVRDVTGAVVSGATVTLRTSTGVEEQTVTGPDGRFTFDEVNSAETIVVRAGGFGIVEQPLTREREIEIVLRPAGPLETVTVTATRTEQLLGNTPASVSLIDREAIRRSPAVVADDVLRQVPTFSLFRRTSSLSSHPTAQGVSLRGIGPSGVSRTLVLLDNVPFNDVFGGWVYWTRVPLDGVDRIEVVDGPSSNLYGNYAMGGVINIVSSRPSARTGEVRAQYGNRNTPKVDLFGSEIWGRLALTADASVFDTDGFAVVAEDERGPIDTKAAVDFRNVNVKVDYRANSRLSVFGRTGYFREERDNAKFALGFTGDPEQNDTTWKYVNGGVRVGLPDSSDLQVRLFADFETFNSNFLAVPDVVARTTARVSLDQRVPSKGFGGMAQWSRAFGMRNFLTAGLDWRWVDGDSEEMVFDFATGSMPITDRNAGGTQRSVGFFVQDIITPTANLNVTLSARVDAWRNYDGHFLEVSRATGPTANHEPSLPDRDDTVFSPRAAVLYRFTDQVSAWSAVSWGFRAPTLNELYRGFRVGAISTLPNHQLGPERLVGGEFGVNLVPTSDLTVRATYYHNRVRNPVSNVTVATNTQQRQNLGRTQIRGLQTDVSYRLTPAVTVSGAYLFNDATVREFDAKPEIIGNVLPQVARHRGSLQVVWADPELVTFGVGLQFIGRQFDDDENLRSVRGESEPGLPGYALVDLTASRDVRDNLQVFFGVQNVFDQTYYVGTNPTTIGTPVLVHGGVRVRFGR